jgi:hypothetical protein
MDNDISVSSISGMDYNNSTFDEFNHINQCFSNRILLEESSKEVEYLYTYRIIVNDAVHS